MKNKNEYIPGTNIKKESQKQRELTSNFTNFNGNSSKTEITSNSSSRSDNNSSKNGVHSPKMVNNNRMKDVYLNSHKMEMEENDDVGGVSDVFEKSFFDEDEDDQLLAKLDL